MQLTQKAHAPAALKLYVVGVDGSPHSRTAVRAAASLARMTGAGLVLVHVVVPRQPATASSAHGYLKTYREDFGRAETTLRSAARSVGDVVLQSELRFGDPARALCDRARELGADLVIVGSRRPGKLDVLLQGSVSRAVLPIRVMSTASATPTSIVRAALTRQKAMERRMTDHVYGSVRSSW